MHRGILATAAGIALMGYAQTAAAQYMPHLDPNLYMLTVMNMNNGYGACGPMPAAEIDEARLPAPQVMQAYFAAAQARQPVSPQFRLGSRTAWVLDGQTTGETGLDAVVYPLAVAGNRLDPETLRFFRAGTAGTAQGQWLVLAADGSVAGAYTAQFQREDGVWKLLRLEVSRADDLLAPIMHYCTNPGDLTNARVTGGENQVTALERQLERAERRRAEADARAVEAEASAAAEPDSARRATLARERRAQAAERLADLEETRTKLTEARDKLAEARADLAALEARTTQARNAAAFRLLDDDGKPKGEGGEDEGKGEAR